MEGLKGRSITHYLVLFYNMSGPSPSAVLTALIDFKKCFNFISHNLIISGLASWSCPGWLLRLVASYRQNRSMIVRHRGAHSSPCDLPGSLAQGEELELFSALWLLQTLRCRQPNLLFVLPLPHPILSLQQHILLLF